MMRCYTICRVACFSEEAFESQKDVHSLLAETCLHCIYIISLHPQSHLVFFECSSLRLFFKCILNFPCQKRTYLQSIICQVIQLDPKFYLLRLQMHWLISER